MLLAPNNMCIPAKCELCPELNVPQTGSINCGLLALAYVTEIVNGYDLGQYTFNQTNIRSHLQCLILQQITRLPKTSINPVKGNMTKYDKITDG